MLVSICLHDMTGVVIPPDQTWTLVQDTHHNVSRKFSSGKKGKTLPELLCIIGKIYAKLEEERPGIQWSDPELGSGTCPFWGDHCFLETINIDPNNQVVRIHFGS